MKNRKARKLLQRALIRLMAIASFLSVPLLTTAAPGDLDPTFGVGGKLIDHLDGGGYAGQSVLIQPDGKIITVGYSADGDLSVCSATRHLADGTPDQSFGNGGKVSLDLAVPIIYCNSAALQSDGKIVAAGYGFYTINPVGNGVMVLVRLNPDGSLDTTFDGDGIATTNGDNHTVAFAVAIQTDGKIVAAGLIINPTGNFALVRYNPDGSPDTSFDGDGIATADLGCTPYACDVALQQDGKIVAAGLSNNGSNDDFALVRYNSDGSLDTSFDGDGKVTTAIIGTNDEYASSVAIQSDGKIVAAGSSYNGSGSNFALVRYNMDGSLDTSFDVDGIVTTSTLTGAGALAIQSDGKVIATAGSTNGAAVVRYNPNGTLDTTFSGDGIVITSGVGAVAIQPDGKIVVGYLVRHNTDGSLDTSFGLDGIVTINLGYGGPVYVFDTAIQPDGKIVVLGGGSVARYNVDGSRDTTFGGTGRVYIDRYMLFVDVAIQRDGKIVIAGTDPEGDITVGEVLRLKSDGSLDTSFGTNGIVAPLFLPNIAATLPDGKLLISLFATNLVRLNADGSFDSSFSPCQAAVGAASWVYNRAESVIQPDGKILTVFIRSNATNNFGVFRCNVNGGLDTTFGSGGVAIAPMIDAAAQSIAIQTDGKFVVAGQSRSSANMDWRPTIVRFNPNGSLDTGFGTGGVVTGPSTGRADYPPFADVIIQADGKIVASSTFGSAFALFRYDPNGSLDTTFGGGDGISTVDFNNSTSYFSGSAMALDSQGRAVVVANSWGRVALARFLLHSAKYDFDGDGRADASVFRPSDRTWYLNRSTDGFAAAQFGLATDALTPADYDGDGRTDIAIFRNGAWWMIRSSDQTIASYQFGQAGDVPVPADYTGDGRDEIAIYRDGEWWSEDLNNGHWSLSTWGAATDRPVPADYDGDGRTDPAVYRSGTWYLLRSTQGQAVAQFGSPTDAPVPADYDGDSKTDLAVFRNGNWYLLQSANGFAAFTWGFASDVPVPADYDGDGKSDAAIFRDGQWWVLKSSGGVATQPFGQAGDKPVPAVFAP